MCARSDTVNSIKTNTPSWGIRIQFLAIIHQFQTLIKTTAMNISVLHQLLEQQDASMGEIAEAIGMSKANLYRCIREETIKAQDLEAIARVLGISILTFFPEDAARTNADVAIGNKSIASFNAATIHVGARQDAERERLKSEIARLKDRISHLESQAELYEAQARHLEARIKDKSEIIDYLRTAKCVQNTCENTN